MKREIKFRAWDEQHKVMHYNFQFIKTGDESNDWIIFVSDKQTLTTDDDGIHPLNNPYFAQQFKIMQYTGLKDKNGKDIYEGDIICQRVETDYGERDFEQTVDFNEGAFYPVCECPGYEFEIIGNIYENPELLNQ